MPEESKRIINRLSQKKKLREYNKLIGKKPEYENMAKIMKEYESSVSFALTFIFSLFTSAIGGYFFCKVILQASK